MVCKDLQKVWTDVKPHRRRVLKCMDPPRPKRKRKKKQANRTPPPAAAAPAARRKTVESTYEDEGIQDITRIREIKAHPAKKFASTFPGFY